MSNMNRTLLVEYNAIEYGKELLEQASNYDKPLVLKNVLLQKAQAKNQNGRIYPEEILMREAQTYKENFVAQRRALGELDHPECMRKSAEILTETGWKLLTDVTVGENVPTLNTSTGEVEYHPIQRVINQPYKGKMISMKGKNLDVLVTPNHRFVLQDRHGKYLEKTASEILDLSKKMTITHLTIPKVASGWKGTDYTTFELPAVDLAPNATKKNRDKQSKPLLVDANAWFSFLGIYLSEGHATNREKNLQYGVFITQNEGGKAEEIRRILRALSPELQWKERSYNSDKVTFVVHDARLHSYLAALGNKYTKYIPSEIKNASTPLLQNLFNGYLLGDGSVVTYKGHTRTSIFSVSKQLMEDFQEVLLRLGMTGRIKKQESLKEYSYAGHKIQPNNKVSLYRLWIERSKNIHLDFRFISIAEEDFDDTVHCVTVQNSNFYCRDAGKAFWSGNSPVVNLKNVCCNVTDLWFDGPAVMGNIEILSTPAGNIVRELIRNNIRLGISSRGLGSVRPIGENTVEVQPDFSLVCFDIVSNPSTMGAFINEQKETKIISPYTKIDSLIYEFLTEVK